jgi:hypothetical protein
MEFRQIENGPTFEIYQGATCVVRVDWTPMAVRTIAVGHAQAEAAEAVTRRFEAQIRAGRATFIHFLDVWDYTGHESGFRTGFVDWTQKHPGVQKEVHVLTRSKFMNMAIAVANLALSESLVRAHSKRTDFDILVKKTGIPLNVSMPAFRPASAAGA